MGRGSLRPRSRLVAGPWRAGAAGARRHRRLQRLAIRRHPEGLFPAAGYRPVAGWFAHRPEHQLPGDPRQARPDRPYHQGRPRRRHRHRLHRRQPRRRWLRADRAEAARRTQRRHLGRCDETAATQTGADHRRGNVPAAGAGCPHRRPSVERRLPVHAEERRPDRAVGERDETCAGAEGRIRADRHRFRPATQRHRKLCERRLRSRRAAGHHRARC